MLYAAKSLMRVSLTTRHKCSLGKRSTVFSKKSVSFFSDLFKQCFFIEKICFCNMGQKYLFE